MQLPDEHKRTATVEKMKKTFATLKGHETEILHLLRSVADSLEACPDLGTSHSLTVKWDGIRQVRPRNSMMSPAISKVIEHCVGISSVGVELQTRGSQLRHGGIP